MKRLTFLLLVLLSFPLAASHIVGGEIELLHVSGFTYRFNLIYYFDVAQNPNRNIRAEEPDIKLYIFRKSDNVMIDSVVLDWLDKTRVLYSQPHCSGNEIISDKIVYTTTRELPAAKFSDPGGYYVTWARCCRNYTILNIFSQDPAHGGQGAGQTFYLEFPPVTINGQQFVNSSPKNFPALTDYACPTKPYYVDFAGVDDDGDSLAYTLTTPFSTVSVTPLPPPTSAPYPLVNWLPGFDLQHIVNNRPASTTYPDLRISTDGFLRVTPRSQGLFVFAVKVEEYRNKIKIGEVRRDFQMLVTDCRLSVPPEISGKAAGDPLFKEGEISVEFDNTVSDDDRYITVSISDFDATRFQDDFEEKINLKVVALNFKKKDLGSIRITPTSGTIHNDGTLEAKIQFPACPFFFGGPYQVGVIAYDDACALPLTDTLRVNVDIEPPANERVKFNPPDEVAATLNEGEEDSWDFEAHDADGDDLLFFVLAQGFSPGESGMKTTISQNASGVLKGKLEWDTACDQYDFTKRTDFTLRLLVDDVDQCDVNDPDTLTYDLRVLLPHNNEPFVDTDLTPNPFEVEVDGIEKKVLDKWSFQVTGTDVIDNDLVTVKMVGDGFDPAAYGMSFEKVAAFGTAKSTFNWDIQCSKIDSLRRDTFNIAFLAIDSLGKCRVRYLDSLVVKVKILKPDNAPPTISFLNLSSDVEFDGQDAVVWPGQTLNLQVDVTDTDSAPPDLLSVNFINAGGDTVHEPTWSFTDATGPSVLSALFSWAPECSLFNDNVFEHDFFFDFQFSDDRCLTAVTDTVRVNVKVRDRESGTFAMDPANVFTPNGDGVNDFYSMERRDAAGELVNILPPDNCQGMFETIRIYNRWGRAVFTSTDRNFRWYGLDEAAGVYFYHVVFSNREFKGTVSLRD